MSEEQLQFFEGRLLALERKLAGVEEAWLSRKDLGVRYGVALPYVDKVFAAVELRRVLSEEEVGGVVPGVVRFFATEDFADPDAAAGRAKKAGVKRYNREDFFQAMTHMHEFAGRKAAAAGC
ncbi:hypothetical protein [Akkermansia glycaniphila]|uniref:Uncharacterized protein n=1 Tax=Akkermansia glycaniphila TaxID=1679444 RepID=A0A1C7P9E4_9BACT|nr:hypothetical protein [Akkermansia glycaniphila]OCA02181.1 hypothetical protein AC781_11520 [Akkermansia glycaniphila]SEH99460.1 Hypothetical protein PYTT_2395 [Akkermansia glycaniphila]